MTEQNLSGERPLGAAGVNLCEDAGSPFCIDFEKYFEYTKDFEMSEDQQRQLIEALWQIMMAFLDFKYGIHPAQCALNAGRTQKTSCGQDENSLASSAPSVVDMIKSLITESDDLKETFRESAGSPE